MEHKREKCIHLEEEVDNWKKEICTAMWRIIRSHNSDRIERKEAAKVICAINGVLLPDVDEGHLSATASVKLRRAKAALVESILADGKLPKLRAERDDPAVSEPIAAPDQANRQDSCSDRSCQAVELFRTAGHRTERVKAEQAEPGFSRSIRRCSAALDLAKREKLRSGIGSTARSVTCACLCHQAGGELEQIQFLLGHVSIQTTERYLGCKQRFRNAVNDHIGLEPDAHS